MNLDERAWKLLNDITHRASHDCPHCQECVDKIKNAIGEHVMFLIEENERAKAESMRRVWLEKDYG